MSDRVVVFNKARIEQIDTPIEIYNRPATKFVGQFVGDSNFLHARADNSRRGLLHVDGIGAFVADASHVPSAAQVDVLLRPEKISINRHYNENHANRFEFDIENIINYGDYCLLIGMLGEQPLRIRTSARNAVSLRVGQREKISWEGDDMHMIAA